MSPPAGRSSGQKKDDSRSEYEAPEEESKATTSGAALPTRLWLSSWRCREAASSSFLSRPPLSAPHGAAIATGSTSRIFAFMTCATRGSHGSSKWSIPQPSLPTTPATKAVAASTGTSMSNAEGTNSWDGRGWIVCWGSRELPDETYARPHESSQKSCSRKS